jgi:FkbM family methyltransferase
MPESLIKTLYRFMSRAPNYVKRFGITQGLMYSFLIEIHGKDKPTKIIKLKPKTEEHPIYLRSTRSDRSIFWQCIVRQQYDIKAFKQTELLQKRYETLINKGITPFIIDCGANIGLSIREFSKMFPLAAIIAVEPDSDNLRMLHLNTKDSPSKLNIIPGAVWSKKCDLQIANRTDGAASYQVTEIETKQELAKIISETDSQNIKQHAIQEATIKATTVNAIVHDHQIDEILIIKLDVEGSQKEIFSADTTWMKKVSLTLIELDDWLLPWQGTSRPFISAVARLPADYLLHGELLCVFRDWNALNQSAEPTRGSR